MRVAVVCASHYGATRGIAEHLAGALVRSGADVAGFDAAEPPHAEAVAGFDAFVVGSAVYMGHWLRDAASFVRRYQPTLLEHPIWLFSSGPLGTPAADESGAPPAELNPADLVPAEIGEFTTSVRPVGHRVFSGAIDTDKLSLPHRMIRKFPGAAEKIPAGDFRDWAAIDAWGLEIAGSLGICGRPGEPQPTAPSQPR
ncbi:flavodoxin domain-containing protein [Cryobacterium arcticum]|uniref:Protoporphyrinogen oxidase n=1 Tax=Cryobacterium arcticum TaxID=670052 RepID=A0A317ZT90_9MICO|nr:flavodoxin domain-containing protein [Cryobacterium arcticum]PXA67924.1 protoporphyrinogen oxidase [Cryobacterium arcticum]